MGQVLSKSQFDLFDGPGQMEKRSGLQRRKGFEPRRWEQHDFSRAKGRQVQVVYVYQEPHLAWQFVQARELVEGRSIPAERFVHQFFESRGVRVSDIDANRSKDLVFASVVESVKPLFVDSGPMVPSPLLHALDG